MRVPLPILDETVSVMKLASLEHEQMKQKTAEFLQLQFINKVGGDRVKVQRQVPLSKKRRDEAAKISQNSVQRRNRGFQVFKREQMPQEQFQRVNQNQNPSPESSEKDRASTVTAHKKSDA